jgi:nuclease-like protein
MAGEPANLPAHRGPATSRDRARAEQMLREAERRGKGVPGEEVAAHALAQLPAEEWHVFHDLHWPGRPRVTIDHVAVGPQGVFVIDTREWAGEVTVTEGILRHGGRRRTKVVDQVTSAAASLAGLLPLLQADTVRPVLCFVAPDPVFGWAGDTMVCSTENLLRMLTSRPPVLDELAVAQAGRTLRVALGATASSVPSPRPLAPAPRPRRRVSSEGLARRLILVGIGAVLVSTVLRLDLLPPLRDKGLATISELRAPTEPVGETQTIRHTPVRPALDVSADAPVVTRSTTSSVRPAAGDVLLAVRMVLRNGGGETWTSFPGTRIVLRDDRGRTHQVNPVVRTVTAGRVLPALVRLRPGRTTRGFAVFEVPRGTTVARIELTVGPGRPETVRWKVD